MFALSAAHGALRGVKRNTWRRWFVVAFLVVCVSMGSAVLVWGFLPDVTKLRSLGYPGAFLLGLATNATVFMPPVLAGATFPLMLGLAADLNLFWVAVVYALGAAIGELVGYGVGMGSVKVLHYKRESGAWARIERLLHKRWWSLLGITALSMLPFPPFDATGIVAGSVRYPVSKFFVACFAGRLIKYLFLLSVGEAAWNVV